MKHRIDDPVMVKDAGVVLGISTESVRARADRGELPVARTPNGTRIFSKSELTRIAKAEEQRRRKREGDE